MAIPVNSTVLANQYINSYFESASSVDAVGENDKIILMRNGELKTITGDNLVSEEGLEDQFETWLDNYLPVDSTEANSLISGTQTQKLNNLTTASATTEASGYMTSVDKIKLNDLTTYGLATTTTNGLMSTADKVKLNNVTTYGLATAEADGLLKQLNNNVNQYLNGQGNWATPPDTNTTYALATTAANGLLKKLSNTATQYMNGQGNWTVPTNTTYGVATTAANGLLLKLNNSASYFMNGKGAWAVPPNTTYGTATTAAQGLMPAADKIKVNKINNNWYYTNYATSGQGVYIKFYRFGDIVIFYFLAAPGGWATNTSKEFSIPAGFRGGSRMGGVFATFGYLFSSNTLGSPLRCNLSSSGNSVLLTPIGGAQASYQGNVIAVWITSDAAPSSYQGAYTKINI